MIGDGKGMVILAIGYHEVVVPAKAATLFMEYIANGGAYKMESKWMKGKNDGNNGSGSSIEIIEPAEISVKLLPLERVALAKLNGEVYRQYKEEDERSKQT
jgi:hypothetical protein